MKAKKRIFNGFIIAVLTAVVSVPAFADGECMQEDRDMIAAPFAMCSTHAYNIAFAENPDPANREFMREVIGMKTTFFTQQLYKQYDQLDSMVRRLKTQLKKAVLLNNLKAAGAKSDDDDDSGSSYSASKNDYVQISGAKDCTTSWSKKEIFDCLAGNYTLIKNGDKSTAYKKQLKQDYNLACKNVAKGDLCLEKDEGAKKKDVCRGTITNNNFSDCLNNLYSLIVAGKEEAADKEAERNNPWQQMMKKEQRLNKKPVPPVFFLYNYPPR